MEIIEIKSNEEFNEQLKQNNKVLVDFNANWCGPCRMLRPILETVESDLKVLSVNTDELDELATSYSVMSIPCVVLIENELESKRFVGLHAKEEIEEFIK